MRRQRRGPTRTRAAGGLPLLPTYVGFSVDTNAVAGTTMGRAQPRVMPSGGATTSLTVVTRGCGRPAPMRMGRPQSYTALVAPCGDRSLRQQLSTGVRLEATQGKEDTLVGDHLLTLLAEDEPQELLKDRVHRLVGVPVEVQVDQTAQRVCRRGDVLVARCLSGDSGVL